MLQLMGATWAEKLRTPLVRRQHQNLIWRGTRLQHKELSQQKPGHKSNLDKKLFKTEERETGELVTLKESLDKTNLKSNQIRILLDKEQNSESQNCKKKQHFSWKERN